MCPPGWMTVQLVIGGNELPQTIKIQFPTAPDKYNTQDYHFIIFHANDS